MDAKRMAEIASEEITRADFDRAKYQITAIEHVSGTAILLSVITRTAQSDGQMYREQHELDCEQSYSEDQIRELIAGQVKWAIGCLEDNLVSIQR